MKGESLMNKREYIQSEIDYAIKCVWCKDIKVDYDDSWIFQEDSLKATFYYFLRKRLFNLCEKENIRIITEFNGLGIRENKMRSDLAVVELDNAENDSWFIENHFKSVYAIVEFKLAKKEEYIQTDVAKVKKYLSIPQLEGCQFYLGFLSHHLYDSDIYWLDGRQTNNWADGKVTELVAHIDSESENELFYLISHNYFNKKLDKMFSYDASKS